MGVCKSCGNGMIGPDSICGRVGCGTTVEDLERLHVIPAVNHGKKEHDIQLAVVLEEKSRSMVAPLDKSFVIEDLENPSPAMAVAVSLLHKIRRSTYKPCTRTRGFLGKRSNALSGRYGCSVVYKPWNIVRDIIIASDYAFTRATVVETSRHVESFDSDYAERVRYGADNYALYLRDKRTREVVRG